MKKELMKNQYRDTYLSDLSEADMDKGIWKETEKLLWEFGEMEKR